MGARDPIIEEGSMTPEKKDDRKEEEYGEIRRNRKKENVYGEIGKKMENVYGEIGKKMESVYGEIGKRKKEPVNAPLVFLYLNVIGAVNLWTNLYSGKKIHGEKRRNILFPVY